MVNTIVFDDESALFWDKEWNKRDKVSYQVLLNGEEVGITDKTHFELKNLNFDTAYSVEVRRFNEKEKKAERLWAGEIKTKMKKKRIDVTKPPYNAVGDGKKMNTQELQRALDDCDANTCVYFPKGEYLTGALAVKSDTEIYLEEGAILQGTTDRTCYLPKCWGRFEGTELMCYRSLLNIGQLNHSDGYTCKNVIIRGGGVVSGGGADLANSIIEAEKESLKTFLSNNKEYVSTCESENTIPGRVRSKLVSVNNAENVVFANVTFQYGSAWNVHMTYSKNVITYNCKIVSHGVWNGDGWDTDSSENCVLFGCQLDTGDDGVAIKSGKNPEGNIINRPTKNVRIFDCAGRDGIAIGSELSGGIENVFIWDCDMADGNRGFRIKTTKKRGGYVKGVHIKDCVFSGVRIMTGYDCNDDGQGSGEITKIENIQMENVTCKNLMNKLPMDNGFYEMPGFVVEGFEEKENHIKNVKISGLNVKKVFECSVSPIMIKNVTDFAIEDLNFIDE